VKEFFKRILKSLRLYHFLQGGFRQMLFRVKRFFSRINYAKYKGTGFTCNCCCATYSRFIADHPSRQNANAINANHVIAGYGENILCPACLSTARERLIIAILENQPALNRKKILHFSPEKNIYNYLKERNDVITADLEPLFYTRIDSDIKKEDATGLSFPDHHFEMVIANHILEHIPDDKRAMTELCRVLKPGGQAILQVPYSTTIAATLEEPGTNDPKRQSALFGQKDHVRIYQLEDYLQRLRSCGFTVSMMAYEELSPFYRYAIQENEVFIRIGK
jgi:SAM-dependent methyltransferase